MSTPNDGGEHIPAFPETWGNSDSITTNPGMTLRDYFAGQALLVVQKEHHKQKCRYREDDLASAAYILADAMLAERAKR
jgi:hypothetical protein